MLAKTSHGADSQASPGGAVGRKHRFSEASESDGTPTTLSLRQRTIVKRMKREEEEEGSQAEQGDRPRRCGRCAHVTITCTCNATITCT